MHPWTWDELQDGAVEWSYDCPVCDDSWAKEIDKRQALKQAIAAFDASHRGAPGDPA